MKAILSSLALAVAALAAPAQAGEAVHVDGDLPIDEAFVTEAVDAFMQAISSDDKTELAAHMLAEGMIFVHNRMDPANPRVDVVPVSQHLERWAGLTSDYEEIMRYDTVLVSGDMAQVWGPYSFSANGAITHCGVNSISLVRGADLDWKIANTSFTMVAPQACGEVGADWVEAE